METKECRKKEITHTERENGRIGTKGTSSRGAGASVG